MWMTRKGCGCWVAGARLTKKGKRERAQAILLVETEFSVVSHLPGVPPSQEHSGRVTSYWIQGPYWGCGPEVHLSLTYCYYLLIWGEILCSIRLLPLRTYSLFIPWDCVCVHVCVCTCTCVCACRCICRGSIYIGDFIPMCLTMH